MGIDIKYVSAYTYIHFSIKLKKKLPIELEKYVLTQITSDFYWIIPYASRTYLEIRHNLVLKKIDIKNAGIDLPPATHFIIFYSIGIA